MDHAEKCCHRAGAKSGDGEDQSNQSDGARKCLLAAPGISDPQPQHRASWTVVDQY